VLLTHWDAEVYPFRRGDRWLKELIISSLLFGEVLVRDVDLFMTPALAERLRRSATDLETLLELIRNGCVEVLTLPPKEYENCSGISTDPQDAPFTARAQRHLASRSFAGQKWNPTPWQWELCKKLDEVVVTERGKWQSIRGMKDFSSQNMFASELGQILQDRLTQPPDELPQFPPIDEESAKMLIRLCRGEVPWEDFLRASGAQKIEGQGQGFYRTAVYQCAEHLHKASVPGIRSLAQSVNAWCECDREGTEGRYGGRLWEKPYAYTNETVAQQDKKQASRIEIVPGPRVHRIPIFPGIGEALAMTRGSDEFKYFQENWAAIESVPIGRDPFFHSFAPLVQRFAEDARRSVQISRTEERAWELAYWVLVASEVVALTLGLNPELPFAGALACKTGPFLSRVVRSSLFTKEVRNKLLDVVEPRFTKVV
jgi:hypothetical protein